MSGIDEQALSRRLHQELGALPAPAAPVGAVIRRGAARRTRRWVATASGLAAVAAVAAAVPLLAGHAQPTARLGRDVRASQAVPAGSTGSPGQSAAPVLTGTTFAAGTAAGQPWQLSVRDIADPGARCLPAIMLNATDGYLPPAGAGVAGGIASLAFLTNVPSQPGTGYAALRVSPDVTRLTVGLRDGRTLALRPVPVQACGAGCRWPGSAMPGPGWPPSPLTPVPRC